MHEFNASIVATMAEGLALLDPEGRLTFANPKAQSTLGYTVGELIGQHWSKTVPLSEQPIVATQNVQRAEGVSNSYETKVLTKAGHEIPVLASATPFTQGGQFAGTLVAFTDITERKQAEEALAERARLTVAALLPVLTRALQVRRLRLENLQLRETVALYDLSLAVTRTLDVSTLLRTAAEVALQVSKAEAVAILLPTDDGQALTVAVARGKDWEHLAGQRLPLRRDGAGQEAPASWPETAGMVEMDGFAVPLLMGGNWLGEIRLAPPSSRPGFMIGDRKALDLLASIVAPALESAKLHTQVQAAEERYRQLVGYLQTVRENEKARVAREIHDELGHALTAMNLDLAALRNLLPKNHQRLREKAYAIGTELETTMRTVQRIATELRPGVLDHVGLAAAIEWQTRELCARAHLHYQFTSTLEDDRLLTQQYVTAIYRIFQEALTNIARHANATTVEITLAAEAGHVVLRVSDNGKGISLVAQGNLHSFGLLSMRERAAALGGEVLITGIPAQGTTVTAKIPLRPSDVESERSDDPRAHCG